MTVFLLKRSPLPFSLKGLMAVFILLSGLKPIKAQEENTNYQIIAHFTKENSPLPHDFVQDLAITSEDVVWIATNEGLGLMTTAGKTCIDSALQSLAFPADSIQLFLSKVLKKGIKSLLWDEATQSLWLGTYQYGLIQKTKKQFYYYSGLKPYPAIIAIAIERQKKQNLVWFGTEEEGLFSLVIKQENLAKETNAAPDFQLLAHPHQKIKRVFQILKPHHNSQEKWIATEKGLFTYDGKKWKMQSPHLTHALYFDEFEEWGSEYPKKGKISATLYLSQTENQQPVFYQNGEKETSKELHLQFRQFLRDEDGTLWGASSFGLLFRKKGESHKWQKSPLLPALPISALRRDKDGRIWVATMGQGIFVIENLKNKVSKDSLANPTKTFMIEGQAIKVGEVLDLKVQFQRASAELSDFGSLEALLNLLRQNPTMQIELSGHTDNIGDEQINLKLSERRAQAVKDFLILHGIEAERISTKGYGSQKPLNANLTEKMRRENRRVELRIIAE
jgi:outer membrane protein OmpA-like peptidoglycan-associated protein